MASIANQRRQCARNAKDRPADFYKNLYQDDTEDSLIRLAPTTLRSVKAVWKRWLTYVSIVFHFTNLTMYCDAMGARDPNAEPRSVSKPAVKMDVLVH